MSTSQEIKDFLAAFGAIDNSIRQAKHDRMMERYYEALIKSKNKPGVGDIFRSAHDAPLGGVTTSGSAGGGEAIPTEQGRGSAVPTGRGGSSPSRGGSYVAANAPAFLDGIAQKYGINPDYLKRSAWIESRYNPNARAGSSSAGGLFQFTDKTAKAYGLANKFDAQANADAAARLAVDNRNTLQKVLGRAPTDAELYLAHQQGPAGAAQLLRNPNTPAIAIVGREAVVNNGGKPDMTAQQFANLWLRKYDSLGSSAPASASPSEVASVRGASQPAQNVGTPSNVARNSSGQTMNDYIAHQSGPNAITQADVDRAGRQNSTQQAIPTPTTQPAPSVPQPPQRPQDLSAVEPKATAPHADQQSEDQTADQVEDAGDGAEDIGSAPEAIPEFDTEQFASRGGMIRAYANGGLVNGDGPDPETPSSESAEEQSVRAYESGGAVDDESEPLDNPTEESQEPATDQPSMQAIPLPPRRPADLGITSEGNGPAPPPAQPQQAQPQQVQAQGGELFSLPEVLDSVGEFFNGMLGDAQGAIGQHSETARAWLSGQNAASPQDMEAIKKVGDPSNSLEQNIRLTRGLQAVFNFYLANGDMNKAQSAAASVLTAARLAAAREGDRAMQEFQRGNVDGAVQAVLAGDGHIPNGLTTKAEKMQDGTYGVIQIDQNGKVVQQGRVTPEMILGAANGLKNGSEFWRQMELAAGKKYAAPTQPAGPSAAYTAAMGRLGGGGGGPVVGEPQATPSAIPTGAATPGGNTPATSASPATVGPMPSAEEWGQMTPAEQSAYMRYRNGQASDTAYHHRLDREAQQDQRRQAAADAKAAASKPDTTALKVGDRGRLSDQLAAAGDEAIKALPERSDDPTQFSQETFTTLRPKLTDTAFHLSAHNELSPQGALAAAARLASIDPNKPDAKPFTVSQGKNGAVMLRALDGNEYNLSQAGYQSLLDLRQNRAQLLKDAMARKAKSDARNRQIEEGVSAVGNSVKRSAIGTAVRGAGALVDELSDYVKQH